MAKNFLEMKIKAQKNLRILDVLITVALVGYASYLFGKGNIGTNFYVWAGFALVSLALVIFNPVEKVEKKMMDSIVKGRK